MGARSHIRVSHRQSDTSIYLYTHHDGRRICQLLAAGLIRAGGAGRIDDPPYATRIVFDTLTGLTGEATGHGIHIGVEPDWNYEPPHLYWPPSFRSNSGTEIFPRPRVDYRDDSFSVNEFCRRYSPLESERQAP